MKHFAPNKGFSEIEYLTAKTVLKSFDSEHFSDADYFTPQICGQIFDESFQGSLVQKPNFVGCSFTDIQFEGNNAIDSSMVKSDFVNVVFQDVCMNYSNLTDSKFSHTKFVNCGCSNCNFSGTKILDSSTIGCDFIRSYFYETTISKTEFLRCSFEEAEFKDSKFLDVDLSQAGLDYAFLDSVSFTRTILPFWGVLRSFGGLNALSQKSEDVQIKYSSFSREISVAEFLSKLESLQAYFYKKGQYFVLANVCIFLGRQMEALTYILEGLQLSIQARDFRTIRHLCELASKNRFFSKKNLRQLYDLLTSDGATADMNYYEYRLYLAEIQKIKHLLIDNPFGLPRMRLIIQTSIPCDDYKSLAILLRFIDKSIQYYLPQSIYSISIYRNSPPQLDVSICEALKDLFPFLLLFATIIFGAGNKSVGFFKELYEAKGIRLENREKEIHLKAAKEREELKTEHMKMENKLLQLQIEAQKLDLLEKRRNGSSVADEHGNLQLPAEVKSQIHTVRFSVQSDSVDLTIPRQGIFTDDMQNNSGYS